MSLMMSRGDICRNLAKSWKVSSYTVERYYDQARKRQIQILDNTPEELKGNSLNFWGRKLQEAISQRDKASKDIEEGREFARQAKTALEKMDINTETLRQLDNIMKRAERMIKNGHSNLANADATARGIMDRLDRLAGNLAPDRIALVNTKGEDVNLKPEPLTQLDIRQNIINIVQGMKATASKSDMEVLQPLLDNGVLPLEIPIEECEEEK